VPAKNVYAWYALRRTLPPWRFEENLAEMVAVLSRYRIDEVIIKVDVEEFSHGQVSVDQVRRYQPCLVQIREAMTRLGIVYSLNPWTTHGHCDRGRDARTTIPGAQMIVGHDGTRTRACACSLSKPWRRYIARVWQLYAQTGPRVIWVEDDIRLFNHMPAKFGCFCPLHLGAFSRRVGRKVSREQLVKAIVRSAKPHPWRAVWLDMLGEQMIDTAAFLARTVHDVDKDICLGLMSSGHHYHGVEGRRWNAFANALGDGRPLYSRAPMGNYTESSLRGLYYSHDSIKGTRHVLPRSTIEQTEVENFSYTRYGNSVVFTFLKMAISFAYGSHGVTLNLFDHCGSPMEQEPGFGRMLAQKKPFLEALARACQAPGSFRGVRLLHHEMAAYVKRTTPGDDYAALAPVGESYMTQLEACGIPTTYDDESVINASGESVAAFEDDEIRDMLRRGVLLDAVAANVLVERGFGRAIGLRSVTAPTNQYDMGPLGAEEFHDAAFGGAGQTYLTMTLGADREARVSVLHPLSSARVVSHLVDPDARRVLPCMTAFENRLGGRVVVMATDQSSIDAVSYHRPLRTMQMQNITNWLARGKLPLRVTGDGAWPLAFRKDCDDHVVLGFFNLSLDDWAGVNFDLDAAAGKHARTVQVLDGSGCWRKEASVRTRRSKGRWQVCCNRPVPHRRPLILRFRRT